MSVIKVETSLSTLSLVVMSMDSDRLTRRSKSNGQSSSETTLIIVDFDARDNEVRMGENWPSVYPTKTFDMSLKRNRVFLQSVAVAPVYFLQELLQSRGYDYQPILANLHNSR